ncbi:hypothetical protein RFA54_004364 [Vibrio vulnificus]|uniref:hypothetical protein n=1 Tax=Vibrio diabolicus TaxID=50719 RepID=UPI001112C36B|nr:hypothetical protein [Vibrio diabolicus]EHK9181975.1 hypothetical protein [Vibrio parahaemolyticus]EKZ9180845.1 hypothetical protein [Vibrio vulnificus]TNC10897.1 hypothetical protein FHG74_07745 [Vibrio diabolicus]
MSTGQNIRALLRAFDELEFGKNTIMIPKSFDNDMRRKLLSALASDLLSKEDLHIMGSRFKTEPSSGQSQFALQRSLYQQCFQDANDFMQNTKSQFSHNVEIPPTYGQFGASLALERLETTFLSAHICFQLGNSFEGYTLSRTILEQIAWAYTAAKSDDEDFVEKLQSTKSISELKKEFPKAGKLYGILSNLVHVGYNSHQYIITTHESGEYDVNLNYFDFLDFSLLILELADMFSIVWELSFYEHQAQLNSISSENKSLCEERKLQSIADKISAQFEAIQTVVTDS